MSRLDNPEDVRRLLEESFSRQGLLLRENQLGENFFNLNTGLAGVLFQQFTNYHQRLALVMPDPGKRNRRLAELAHEHHTHPLIRFFEEEADARAWITEEK